MNSSIFPKLAIHPDADGVKETLLRALKVFDCFSPFFPECPLDKKAGPVVITELETKAMILVALGLFAEQLTDNVDRHAALRRCEELMAEVSRPYKFKVRDIALLAAAIKTDPRLVLRRFKARMKQADSERKMESFQQSIFGTSETQD